MTSQTVDERPVGLKQALAAVTAAITGDPDCPARPGQVAFAGDVEQAMEGRTALIGRAGTGTGKSAAYLVAAALAAAQAGERTVISTESKALQSQLVGKDLPLVSDVVADLTGVEVSFAVHKGFANHVCTLSAWTAAAELAKQLSSPFPAVPQRSSKPINLPGVLREAAERAETLAPPRLVTLDSRPLPGPGLAEVIAWALEQTSGNKLGDIADFTGSLSGGVWSEVSVASDACLGKNCPLVDLCPARQSRAAAADADILVTNHALLAIQAMSGTPVVLSSRRLGHFDHLVVDEAHALPSICRSSGEAVLRASRVRSLAKAAKEHIGSFGGVSNEPGDKVVARGMELADAIELRLASFASRERHGRDRTVKVTAETSPLANMGPLFSAWTTEVKALLPSEDRVSASTRTVLKLRRLKSGLASLVDDLEAMHDPERIMARWTETQELPDGTITNALCFSPVDVGSAMARNLYQAFEPPDEQHRQQASEDGDDVPEPEPYPLSVILCSATIPTGFEFEAGVVWQFTPDQVLKRDYPSPFADAYQASMLFVPRVSPDELERVGVPRTRGFGLDIGAHELWCSELIEQLVEANGGRALVLAAKSSAGKLYAEALRAAGLPHEVLSQWDGLDARSVVQAWREDEASVLVGTRSMMTGVDAAGETCSLVIVDRVPRNPGNPVDDARADAFMASGADRWSADRAVYARDAALLLEQAAGRLVRRTSDAGLVAILDPRLMARTPLSYPESTRAEYMAGLSRFVHRTGTFEVAVDFLLSRRAASAA